MSAEGRLLAVIPARGGSKGLPGKNIRPFAGLPLIAHSILCAKFCPEIERIIVTTDSLEIADVACRFGAEVPFLRPPELAKDETPLWPVVKHVLEQVEAQDKIEYAYLIMLDPTTPCRLPVQVKEAFDRLQSNASADGIIGVSRPDFNPIWHSVVDRDGWMTDLFPEAAQYHRRQDAPVVYRINGSIYIWRTEFVRQQCEWRQTGKHLVYEVTDFSAISIDTEDEFRRAELFVTTGMVSLPWLEKNPVDSCAP